MLTTNMIRKVGNIHSHVQLVSITNVDMLGSLTNVDKLWSLTNVDKFTFINKSKLVK